MGYSYEPIEIEGKIRISPSSIYTAFDNPSSWYKSNVEGKKDKPNINLIFGTCIHNRIENFFEGKEAVDREAYFNNEPNEFDYLQSNRDIILDEWKFMNELDATWTVTKEHLKGCIKPRVMEGKLFYEPKGNQDVFIGGTFDYIYQDTLGDYKSCNSLPSSIKTHHKFQVYLYSWIYNLTNSDKINNIELTYILKHDQGKISEKTGKVIGVKQAEVRVFKEPIEEDYMTYVMDNVKKLAERISLVKANPELKDIIFYNNILSHF